MAIVSEIKLEVDQAFNGTRVTSYQDESDKIIPKISKSRAEDYKTEQNLTQEVKTDVNSNQNLKSSARKTNSIEIIDIIQDYDWTYSSKSPMKNSEVPYIHLKEFKILGNSYMSSLMTSALLFPDIAKSATDQNSPGGVLFSKLKDSFKDNKFGKFMSNIGNSTSDIVNKLETTTKKAADWVKTQMNSIDKTADEWGSGKQDLIDNYSYLYLRKSTNTEYKFPYFDNNFINLMNSFQDSYEGGNKVADAIFGETVGRLNEYASILSSPVALSEPGMFIQRPKFYNFSEEGYEITATFHLFNTLNPDSYIKNLQFITKFLMQNTPHRHNRLLVDPVCLYELTIPGRGFYPYTYVSSLNVAHVGTKRMLQGPEGNKIIVPDAFMVEIKFKSLTSEVNNFMIPEMGTAGIEVSQRYGAGQIIKGMMNNFTTTDTELKQTKTTPELPLSNQSSTIAMNSPKTPIGNSSQPVRIAMGF